MTDERVRLIEAEVLQNVCVSQGAQGEKVFGIRSKWSDGSEITVADISPSIDAVSALRDAIMASDLEKVHFMDIINDCLI